MSQVETTPQDVVLFLKKLVQIVDLERNIAKRKRDIYYKKTFLRRNKVRELQEIILSYNQLRNAINKEQKVIEILEKNRRSIEWQLSLALAEVYKRTKKTEEEKAIEVVLTTCTKDIEEIYETILPQRKQQLDEERLFVEAPTKKDSKR